MYARGRNSADRNSRTFTSDNTWHCGASVSEKLSVKVYLTSPGPSNFGNNFIIFTQFQNKEYHWIPRVLPRLVMGLTKSESLSLQR